VTQTIAPSRASEVVSVRGQGLSLAVRRFEGGAGAPLLLLHGVSSSSTSWQPIADRFGSSWRISAPDLRGHGMSDHDTGGYRFDALRSDVARVLADIGEPAVVVGHSLGGIVAMHLAQGGHPLVRAVFLEDPPVYTISPFVLSCTSFGPLFHALRNAVIQMQAAGEPVSAYRDLLAGSKHPSGGTQGEHMCPDALTGGVVVEDGP
jgi:pimeloyl-ACP methyl ester carboxylesterase